MYKFCSYNENTLTSLRKGEIYCNHYEAFNDPFECWCIQLGGFPDPKNEHGRFINVISAWGFSEDREKEALENYDILIEDLHDNEFPIKDTLDSARISCFCKDADNLLMWAHYADGLRGFCVEFDENILIKNSVQFLEIIPVSYQDSPPVMDTCVWAVAYDQVEFHEMLLEQPNKDGYEVEYKQWLNQSRELLRQLYVNMLATKPKSWEYENEIRLIFHSSNNNKNSEFIKYDDSAIKSIVVGEKMPYTQKSNLLNLINQKLINVPVKTAKRDHASYKVLIE